MKAGRGDTGSRGELLEMQIYRLGAEVPSERICENEIERVTPRRASFQPLRVLQFPLVGQKLHDIVCRGNDTAFPVLGRSKDVFAAGTAHLLELLLYGDRATFEVDTVPRQPQHFTFAHSREESDNINGLILAAFDRIEEGDHFVICKGFYFGFAHFGKIRLVGGIMADIAE